MLTVGTAKKTFTGLEQQERSFKACVQTMVDSSNKRIDELSKEVYDLKVSLEMTQKDFDDFKTKSKVWSQNSCETRSDLDTICKSLLSVSDKVEYLEGHSKRHNIVVKGLKEFGNEKVSESEEKVRKIFSEYTSYPWGLQIM